MKSLIKKLLREDLLYHGVTDATKDEFTMGPLDETMETVESLPENTALFVKVKGNGYNFHLFEPTAKKVYATLSAEYNESKSDFFYVIAVGAEKGFGPLIYELAMMYLNTKGYMLTPMRSGDVRSGAWNVWGKFYDRGNMIMKTLSKDDPKFAFNILHGDDWNNIPPEDLAQEKAEFFSEVTPEEQRDLIIFNTGFSMKPNDDFFTILKRSEEYSEEISNLVDTKGQKLWREKYS